METVFEEKVQGTLKFIDSIPKRKLAEFIVNQDEAIEGLSKNNEAFARSFRNMYFPTAGKEVVEEKNYYFITYAWRRVTDTEFWHFENIIIDISPMDWIIFQRQYKELYRILFYQQVTKEQYEEFNK